MRTQVMLLSVMTSLFAVACSDTPAEEATQIPEETATISVYSTRHYDSDDALYDAFEEKTGIRVRFREGNSTGLLEAMKAEGAASPADVVIATDAGTLWRFQENELLQPVTSTVLENAIPAQFREPDGHWFGLSKRARVIVYDPKRVEAETLDSYGALSDERFADEVCMRSSSNIYNLSLMAELIDRWGADDALAWARGVRGNFARDPAGGDTSQIESIAAGECSVALVNHYYWVRLASSNSDTRRELAENTALSFPAIGAGTHVNITGAGVAANAPNRDAAIAFLEFLISPEGQALLVTETKEFPMAEGVEFPEGLDALDDFVASDAPLTLFGENQAEAQRIYDRAGWK